MKRYRQWFPVAVFVSVIWIFFLFYFRILPTLARPRRTRCWYYDYTAQQDVETNFVLLPDFQRSLYGPWISKPENFRKARIIIFPTIRRSRSTSTQYAPRKQQTEPQYEFQMPLRPRLCSRHEYILSSGLLCSSKGVNRVESFRSKYRTRSKATTYH